MSSPRSRRACVLACMLVVSPAAASALVINGCADDAATGTTADAATAAIEGGDEGGGSDGGADATTTGTDGAACPSTKVLPATGETCIGFAKGTPCDTACGLPAYGYVCFNGGPPGFAGCVQAGSTGSFGDTYCCPENECVPQPDQDKECKTVAKPHRYQCPPDGNGGNVAPPAGCAGTDAGSSALETFHCCP